MKRHVVDIRAQWSVAELGQTEGADVSAPLRAPLLSHALCLLTLPTATIDVCIKRQTFAILAAVEPLPINDA
jgi:hypothetical protein